MSVTAIVTHHAPENQGYLGLCLTSLLRQDADDLKIVVVTDYDIRNRTWEHAWPSVQVICDPSLKTYAQKLNAGTQRFPADHYLWLNDDVILGRDVIKEMIAADAEVKSYGKLAIINADGNGENCAYLRPLCHIVEVDALQPQAIEMVMDYKPNLDEDLAGAGKLVNSVWLALFATLVPHEVIEKVGLLDEVYITGWEDIDYCARCAILGVKRVVTPHAWIYHFMGRSRSRVPDAQREAENEANAKHYWDKLGQHPESAIALLLR